jgi:hypothetical protein
MMEDLTELKSIPAELREPLRQFAVRIKQLCGDNALAWALHGPIVAGAFDKERHTVRSVLVLKTIDLEQLRALANESDDHRDARLAVPLVMTPEFLAASQDTFPLELIEIQQQYHVVFGEDHFAALKFDDQHVRMQCERELKVLSIGLRQGLLASGGKQRYLKGFQQDWADGLLRTLRGMLWLKGQKEGLPSDRVLEQVEQRIGRSLDGVRRGLRADSSTGWDGFKSLAVDFEVLGTAVNDW